ncbi:MULTISPECIES: hypothetical protein [unclassified Rathayibacter]|nr:MULTISPECIES: hypothetical protein [unclassified Rathayibacter]
MQDRFGVDVAYIAEKLRNDQPADFSAEKALAVAEKFPQLLTDE